MCKIVIVEENQEVSESLKKELANMFPEHEVVSNKEYRSKEYIKLESAVDNLIETYTEKIGGHLGR